MVKEVVEVLVVVELLVVEEFDVLLVEDDDVLELEVELDEVLLVVKDVVGEDEIKKY